MNLESYGFIGDMHTCALVGLNGSIDWLCLPRADSNAVFAALLGEEKNGCWRLTPQEPIIRASHRYRKDTLILETEFETASGVVRVIDCMAPTGPNRDVLRVVEGFRGEVAMTMSLIIRMDYGRTIPWVRHATGGGVMAVAGPDALILRTAVETCGEDLSTVARFTVRAGEQHPFVLTWFPSHLPPPDPVDPHYVLARTEQFWREWTSRCTYQGEWRDAVVRSLITLKGLTFSPTGGILAAATTSLPEFIGGVRNWDYRFCWLRDATFTLYSFMEAGYTEEAAAWSEWLLRAVAGDPAQLQIMYGAAGERSLPEFELMHLRGYEIPGRCGSAMRRRRSFNWTSMARCWTRCMLPARSGSIRGLSPGACNAIWWISWCTTGWKLTRGFGKFEGHDDTSLTPRSWRGWRSIERCRPSSNSSWRETSTPGERLVRRSTTTCAPKPSMRRSVPLRSTMGPSCWTRVC